MRRHNVPERPPCLRWLATDAFAKCFGRVSQRLGNPSGHPWHGWDGSDVDRHGHGDGTDNRLCPVFCGRRGRGWSKHAFNRDWRQWGYRANRQCGEFDCDRDGYNGERSEFDCDRTDCPGERCRCRSTGPDGRGRQPERSAVDNSATATGTRSTALSASAQATGINGTALGALATAAGSHGIALGSATASGSTSIAVGSSPS
jgi:hypothetical protein